MGGVLKKYSIYIGSLISLVYIIFLKLFNKGFNIKISKSLFYSSINIKGKLSINMKGGYILKSCIISHGYNNIIEFEKGVRIINCKFNIVGDNCRIKINGSRIIKNSKFEMLDSNTSLIVKDNTGFNNNRIIVAGVGNKIEVGKDCIFAENAEIWSSDTHSIIDIVTNKRINEDLPVIIQNRVWVGNRALIMKGVEIKNDSIIAAGSIVTKNIEANTLVGGIPASVIKSGIKWDVNRL